MNTDRIDKFVDWLYGEYVDALAKGQPFHADSVLEMVRREFRKAAREYDSMPRPNTEFSGGEPAVEVADELGDYVLMERIARGGQGDVWRAKQRSLNRNVALKLLKSHTSGFQEALRHDAESLAKFHHQNILPIFEFNSADGQLYLAMPFVHGSDLRRFIENESLSPREAARLIQQVAEAVHHAHQNNVLHCDIKPGNILLERRHVDDLEHNELVPLITDFGLAVNRSRDPEGVPHSGRFVGTVGYAAPELAAYDDKHIGPWTDVYSLGATLYFILTRHRPFDWVPADATAEYIHAQRNNDPVSPRYEDRTIPRELETICLKCLEREPERRFQTAREVADELGRFLRGEPLTVGPTSPWEHLVKWVRRRPVIAILLAVLLCVIAGGIGGVFWQWRRAEKALILAGHRESAANGALERELKTLRDLKSKHAELLQAKTNAEQAASHASASARDASLARDDAERQAAIASRRAEESRRGLFASQLAHVATVWEHDPERARQLLEDETACPQDLRDFTWRLFHRLCRRQEHVIDLSEELGASGHLVAMTLSRHGQRLAFGTSTTPRRGVTSIRESSNRLVQFSGSARIPFTFSERTGSAPSDEVVVWDTRSQERMVGWRLPTGTQLETIVFHPNETIIAIAYRQSGKTHVEFRDLASGERPPQRITTDVDISDMEFSHDGQRLALAGAQHHVELWDPERCQLLGTLRGHQAEVHAIAFSPDDRWLASGSGDKSVRVWDVKTLDPVTILTDHDFGVTSVAFSPDGESLVTGEGDWGYIGYLHESPPGVARVWSLKSSQLQLTLRGHSKGLAAVAYSPDGSSIATSSDDMSVRLWEASTGRERTVLPHSGNVFDVAFADIPSCLWAATGDNRAVRWCVNPQPHFADVRVELGTTSVLNARVNDRFAAVLSPKPGSSETEQIQVWSLLGQSPAVTIGDLATNVLDFTLAPRDSKLAVVSVHERPDQDDETWLTLWDGASGEPLREQRLPDGMESLDDLAFSADGSTLCGISTFEESAIWWRIDEDRPPRVIRPDSRKLKLHHVALNRDGRLLVADIGPSASDSQHRLAVWDGTTLSPLLEVSGGLEHTPFAISPQSEQIVYVSSDSKSGPWSIRTLDISDWQNSLIGTSEQPIDRLAVSPDGDRVVVALSDHSMEIWDVRRARRDARFTGHSAPIRDVAFSPDGKTMVSSAWEWFGSAIGEVVIWDSVTGQIRAMWHGHPDGLSQVRFVRPDWLLTQGPKQFRICHGDSPVPPRSLYVEFAGTKIKLADRPPPAFTIPAVPKFEIHIPKFEIPPVHIPVMPTPPPLLPLPTIAPPKISIPKIPDPKLPRSIDFSPKRPDQVEPQR